MYPIQNNITKMMLPPQTKNNGAFDDNAAVDLKGKKGILRVLFVVGDTDVAIGSGDAGTKPYVEQADTEGGSYAKVPGAELPEVIGAEDDEKMFAIDVVLNKSHKRFMRVNAPTAGNETGGNLAILGIVSNADVSPMDAAGRGLAAHVIA